MPNTNTRGMGPADTTTMSDDELTTFLQQHGTGVLSLADNDTPYSIPTSYGYDPTADTFYFRLGLSDDSEKQRFLETPTEARFVVYDQVNDTWQSVIARGSLTPVTEPELTMDTALNLRNADLPLFDIWEESLETIEFQIYRLEIETLSARQARPKHRP